MNRALYRLHSDHARVATAGLWLLLFSIAAKTAGAAREITVAWRFGRGSEVDAYNLALTVSTWLPVALASVTAIVLVPLLARISVHEKLPSGRLFLRELKGLSLLGGALLTTATFVTAPWLVPLVMSGLPETTRQLGVEMTRSFAPLALLTVMIGVTTARLQAVHDHRYALAEGIPAIAVVTLVLAWQTADTLALVIGTLSGFALQAWWLHRRTEGIAQYGRPALGFRSEHWGGLGRVVLVLGAGQFAMTMAQPIDQWFAATLGSGEIATLGYVNRIIALGLTLGATVVSRATLPIFAEGVAIGESNRTREHALRWAVLMLLGGALGAAAVWPLATPIVTLLFERGAFSAEDTRTVAAALQWGIWQAPPYFAGLVLVSMLAAQRRYGPIAAIAGVNIGVKLIGNVLLVESLGLRGILAATVLMYGLSTLLCWFALTRLRES